MWPAASVSGYYFANREAKYFGLGKITDDQVTDFANRKGITKEKAKKWLHPNLANQQLLIYFIDLKYNSSYKKINILFKLNHIYILILH